MKYIQRIALIVAMLIIAAVLVQAETKKQARATSAASPAAPYEINWQVTSSGGKSSGGPFRLQQAIGQTAAGFSNPAVRRINSGFEQAFPSGCCVALTGNVDCDPGDGVDISDLSGLIDFLYISFAPLCCLGEANIDGDLGGGIDISDLSALIDYLYISFTPPASCL
jgi:hypothetical protein